MTTKTPDPAASALASKRWSRTSKRQRKAVGRALAAARKAKRDAAQVLTPEEPGSPVLEPSSADEGK